MFNIQFSMSFTFKTGSFLPSPFFYEEISCRYQTMFDYSRDLFCQIPSMMFFDEFADVKMTPDEQLNALLKELSDYSFYIIANHEMGEIRDNNALFFESISLEMEAIDVKKSPEKVAQAVQNQAFVAFKKEKKDDGKIEMKLCRKLDECMKKGKICQIKINQEKSQEICQIIQSSDIVFQAFTAEEIDGISTILFRAVAFSYQIRQREQQKKEAKEKRKNEAELIETWAKQIHPLLINRYVSKGQIHLEEESCNNNSQLDQEAFVEKQLLHAKEEESKKEEMVQEFDDKQARILKREIARYLESRDKSPQPKINLKFL